MSEVVEPGGEAGEVGGKSGLCPEREEDETQVLHCIQDKLREERYVASLMGSWELLIENGFQYLM